MLVYAQKAPISLRTRNLIFIEKCLPKNKYLSTRPLLKRKRNKQREECGEYSGTMASRWPSESSLCVIRFPHSPPLPEHSLARGCQRPFLLLLNPYSHTHHGGTSSSPCPLWRWRYEDQFKAYGGYKELSQKPMLILFICLYVISCSFKQLNSPFCKRVFPSICHSPLKLQHEFVSSLHVSYGCGGTHL